jgi:predicted HAD superfamily Cof-like phosphohydrolase
MTSLEQVKQLHETFNHPVNDNFGDCSPAVCDLRKELLREELVDELYPALAQANNRWFDAEDGNENNPPEEIIEAEAEVLDALCDIQVVLDGAFLALGFWRVKDEAMAEVHRSNMSKLGADGKPILREDGKFLKGPNYFPPNLKPLIEKLYARENGKSTEERSS